MSLKSFLFPALRNLFAPIQCEGCHQTLPLAPALCSDCLSDLRNLSQDRCSLCALPFEGEGTSEHRCEECLMQEPSFSKVTGVFEYDGTASRMIQSVKFGRKISALEVLAEKSLRDFRGAIQEFNPHYMAPVPLSWQRRFKRGFNQSYVLTAQLLKLSSHRIPILDRIRRKHTLAQVKKDRKERLRALKGAFTIRGNLTLVGRKILIVDDVLTTGATAEAMSRTLIEAGAKEVQVFVLARVRKRKI